MLRAIVVVAGLLVLDVAPPLGGCGCGPSADKPETAQLDCSVCSVRQLACTSSGSTPAGTCTIDRATPDGCSGTMVSSTATTAVWLHCATGQICVGRTDLCYQGTSTAKSFSYTPATGAAVTCNAQ
jgi:hypothetical protein